jgi:C-terminal processing protease CtpA/Prc
MKLLDPKLVTSVQDTTQVQQPLSYFVWEQHNVTLIRSSQYGYGIAISGGLNNHCDDPTIIVTDIVANGPAEGKLFVNDKLLSVNGVNVENVEHSFVIRLLKEAKEFIHLVIRRKINDSLHIYNTKDALLKQQEANETLQPFNQATGNMSTIKRCNQAIMQTANTILANFNHTESEPSPTERLSKATIPLLKPIKVTLNRKDKKTDGFGVVLGCKYYIKDILPDTLAANEANLRKGDIIIIIYLFEIRMTRACSEVKTSL